MSLTRYAAAIAVLVAGLGVQPALAGPGDHLELAVGAGYLAHQYGSNGDSPAVVGDIGVSVWLNEHWGLAARYWRTDDYELPYGWYRNPYLYHGRGLSKTTRPLPGAIGCSWTTRWNSPWGSARCSAPARACDSTTGRGIPTACSIPSERRDRVGNRSTNRRGTRGDPESRSRHSSAGRSPAVSGSGAV